jgi:hypothetical protein
LVWARITLDSSHDLCQRTNERTNEERPGASLRNYAIRFASQISAKKIRSGLASLVRRNGQGKNMGFFAIDLKDDQILEMMH